MTTLAILDVFSKSRLSNFAAIQGAASFTPAMVPKMWLEHPCPYSTPLYREAWYRGFYSAACWYLLSQIRAMDETMSFDVSKAMAKAMADAGGSWKVARVPREYANTPEPGR